jgi:hypothetical protein
VVSLGVCPAFQSHFRIIAWVGLPLIADLAREHGVLRSAQAVEQRKSELGR